VDTNQYLPLSDPRDSVEPIVVGWIGSPSTWRFVQPLLPLLAELSAKKMIKVRIVGAGSKADGAGLSGFHFIEWQEANEVRDVQAMDIGIMPLPDELWARGKSGYKLIQYMACGLPVIASPVGVNTEIVQEGVNGFLAGNLDEWKVALMRLIQDQGLRKRMGANGRLCAAELYSLQAHAPRLVDLFYSLR
jgi:glycosyltransferase involved in cell wall biosynthesis